MTLMNLADSASVVHVKTRNVFMGQMLPLATLIVKKEDTRTFFIPKTDGQG